MRSLRSRITLVVVAVAVLAVLVTALVSVQLVRSSANQEAREQLATQADAIAALPTLTDIELLLASLGDTRYAVVSRAGEVTGNGAELVNERILLRLKAGRNLSTVRHLAAGENFFVEARVTQDGSAIVLALPQTRVEQLARAATGRILLALGIGAAVALVAGLLLATWLSRPIRRLSDGAQRLASGERDVPFMAGGPTEVTAIATALHQLDDALSTSEGRQREFLLSISHELRTPLTAVRGYAEALADGMIAPAEVSSVGATLVAETERIDRFVADLLELARLESEDFSVALAPVDLAEVLGAVGATWAAHAARLGVPLTVHAPPVTVATDAQRLRQVIDGLIENALRVTPEGAAVSVSARVDGQHVEIAVADGGPGLTSEDQAVAFERGVLRSRYRDIRPVGTGLGLSIAARLVARLGGTIHAGSAPGGGALFTVRLPRG